MKIDFTDRTVLVTGATRGIGRQIADDLRELGAELILTGTRQDEVERLNAAGNGATYLCVDFTQDASTERFLECVAGRERIDACINNAGIDRTDAVDAFRDNDWDAVLDVDLKAPALITRTVAKQMKARGYGRIVNIASIWGHISRTRRAAYTSAKFGILGLTSAAANDLAAYDILVNAVSPGFTRTEMIEECYSADELQAFEARIPLGRMATTAEISRVVLFLASDLNGYMTGQSVVVDGGYVNS